jgi:hypothetical protein
MFRSPHYSKYVRSIFQPRRTVFVCAAIATVGLLLIASSSGSSSLFAAESAPATATPTSCPPIVYNVVAHVDVRSVSVGDTFTVTVESSGFAGLAQVRLFTSYPLAAVPDLEVYDPPGPLVEVLPTSRGSSLGSGNFDLKAIAAGRLILYAEIYGDAYFYGGASCIGSTQFMIVDSDPIFLTISP